MISRCPYCGSNKIARCNEENGNIKYVLTQIDITSNSFLATQGMPVDVFACVDCKAIMLSNDSLRFNEN